MPFTKTSVKGMHLIWKKTLNLASAVDPRFKALPFLSDEEKNETFAKMVTEAAATMLEHQVKMCLSS